MEQQAEGFKEYPALQGGVQGKEGEWYNLRAYADKEGVLKGKVEIHHPESGDREKADITFKANKKGLGGTFKTTEGQSIYVGLVGEKNDKGYTHAAMNVSSFQKEGNKVEFTQLNERPGRVRMNEAMAKIPESREAKLMEERLGVAKRDLEPYRERGQAQAAPAKAEPEKPTAASYAVYQEKIIGNKDMGADHAVWTGKVMGIDSKAQAVDMESKVGGEDRVTRVMLQAPVPADIKVGEVKKIAFSPEKGYTVESPARKGPGKGVER